MTTEDQIKALEERHKKEIEELKASLIKPQFEVGKWYYKDQDDGSLVARFKKMDGSSFYGDWVFIKGRTDSNWSEYANTFNDNMRLATEEEIKTALVAEAQRRGFKEGVRFDSLERNIQNSKVSTTWYYYLGDDLLSTGQGIIYSKGKWAEIIESPKLTFGGHEVTIEGNKITCKDVVGSYEELKKIYDWFIISSLRFGGKEIERYILEGHEYIITGALPSKVKIGCTWGTMEEIKNILDACENAKS